MNFKNSAASWIVILLAVVAIWGLADGTLRNGVGLAAFGTLLVVVFVIYRFVLKKISKDGNWDQNSN